MTKRKRILFTISNFDTAGSGKVLYDLAKGLDQELFEVEIACGHGGGAFFDAVKALGFPVHVFPTKTTYRPYWSLWKRVRPISQFYKAHDYDLIHSWQWSNDWTEALAARVAGIPWIYTKKAMGFESKHWHIKSWMARYIITINDEMGSYFPFKKNQRLIPLGLDTHFYAPRLKSHRRSGTTMKLVVVANLVAVKGLEVLLYALTGFPAERFHLKVVGKCDNAYGKEMQALVVALGLQDRVNFEGKQTDVLPYLEEADVFVIPTLDEGRKEGMPMALVEAMSMGIPVLGSAITGIDFVLKDFKALLFEAGNSEALAVKLQWLFDMEAEAFEALGQSLRTYCCNHFSLDAFLKSHEALYTELLT